MSSRTRKFLSYYRPYLSLFTRLMACAVLGAAMALLCQPANEMGSDPIFNS